MRKIEIRATGRRAACVQRFRRTPGRVVALAGRSASATSVVLSFRAPGSDGSHPPAARGYLVKQSLQPIRTRRDFEHAQALCKGVCSFQVTKVGAAITLTVTKLRKHTTYYYKVAARDNVTNAMGPRSKAIAVKTR
jgi:hypothetical protein